VVKVVIRGSGAPANWIKDAIKKPGALRKSLGVKKSEKIPASKLAKAAKAPGKMGQRARLAQTLKKMK
jgi:transcription antitermination factor NusA-like protein